MQTIENIAEKLNDFNQETRLEALRELAAQVEAGLVKHQETKNEFNLHVHTFFSYNSLGFSPCRLVWEAKKAGLAMLGTVDFDVLDAVRELYLAGVIMDFKVSAGLETRVFVKELSQAVISSPGEPGIAYFMGIGFVKEPKTDFARKTLGNMRSSAEKRNLQVLQKVNAYLEQINIDYYEDVFPLTPGGNVTERHMLEAYEKASSNFFAGRAQAEASFWADKLEIAVAEATLLLSTSAKFRDKIRAKLMKNGGVGYIAPTADSFPAVEEVIAMIKDAGAIPTITWLDGTSEGEGNAEDFLQLFINKDCQALNIIPDRNWCISDPEEKKIKISKLEEIVRLCTSQHIPVIIGTEMNKAGQKFVDTFSAPELNNVVEEFRKGADFLFAHTMLEQGCECGVVSDWSKENFTSRKQRVDFYQTAGEKIKNISQTIRNLQAPGSNESPEKILSCLE